jgi:hypothetical protein
LAACSVAEAEAVIGCMDPGMLVDGKRAKMLELLTKARQAIHILDHHLAGDPQPLGRVQVVQEITGLRKLINQLTRAAARLRVNAGEHDTAAPGEPPAP